MMRDAALALAAKGFRVFPVKPGAKYPPLYAGWPEKASASVADVTRDWAQWPDANIGIHCDGYLVLDVDVKKGGDESLSTLEKAHGLPETLTTITPTGGRHLFYRLPEGHPGVPNSVATLGDGLDVRSNRGFVIGPASTVKAGRYRFAADVPVADAPQWLVQKLGTFTKREQPAQLNVPDAPEAIVKRAQDWLAQQPGAVEGDGGDAYTYKVAAELRDLGVSAEQAINLLDNYWNERCAPPWPYAVLAEKTRNAYRYAQNEPGTAVALPTDFPVTSVAEPVKPKLKAVRLSDFANSESRGPGYLVKGLLQRRSYAEMFGAPGAGKTFTALDVAYCVAAGEPWMGRRVHAGTVLYLAYEGAGGMVKRAQALRQKYGHKDVPLYVAHASFNLREKPGRQELGLLIGELPEVPVLIVVDTFARALMGGDENSAQDVGAFNSAVGALIDSTGACVMIIHHSGKNKNAGARGSSALLGAIDTELEVGENEVVSRKQRDVEAGDPIGFKLVPMVVGLDEDGDELTSCVVEPDVVRREKVGRLAGNAKRGFDVLCELRPTNEPITEVEWRESCKEFLPKKGEAQRFWDVKNALLKKKLIEVNDDGLITRRCE